MQVPDVNAKYGQLQAFERYVDNINNSLWANTAGNYNDTGAWMGRDVHTAIQMKVTFLPNSMAYGPRGAMPRF